VQLTMGHCCRSVIHTGGTTLELGTCSTAPSIALHSQKALERTVASMKCAAIERCAQWCIADTENK
jgi:hypothetical protein